MNTLPILSSLLAAVLVTASQAQERTFAPLPPSSGVKTAPEPDLPPRAQEPRPLRAHADGPVPAPRAKAVDPRAPLERRRGIDRSRVYYDAPGDGSLWARGAHYKASFDAAGATYYPLFGAGQPRHFPHPLSPASVTLDGEPLDFARAARASRAGDRVEFDRGGFVEAYELAPDSMEQLFVFSWLPRGGELVVRIPLGSELSPAACVEKLEFHGELGHVGYGRAVAIDAEGRRASAATEFEDGSITIRVGADFLASAALPLTIDPVVSTFPIDTTSFDNFSPDVAYDATTQRWLVVYQERAAAGDLDAYYVICDANGNGIWSGYVNLNNADWGDVSCGNLASATQFLVASDVDGSGSHEIRARLIEADVNSIGGEFFVSGGESGGGEKLSVDVGGDPYPTGPAFYCVAYERFYDFGDHDVLVRLVGSDGSVTGPTYLSNSGGTIDGLVSVSKANGGSTWVIAWNRAIDADHVQVWGGRVRYDGYVLNGPFPIAQGYDDNLPKVSSPLVGSQRTMVVFQRDFGPDYDIQGVVLDGASVVTSVNLSSLENTWYLQDQINPSVDSDGHHFSVAYSEQYSSSTTDYDVYVSDFYLSGNTLGLAQTHQNLAFGTEREGVPAIASKQGSGGPNRRYFVAWQKEVSSTNRDVHGALFDGNIGGPTSPFCFGDGSGPACPCGNNGAAGHGCRNSVNANGGLLTLSGTASTVNDTVHLNASGVPGTATCIFLQGNAVVNPVTFGDGLRCAGGTLIRLATKAASGGIAIYPTGSEIPVSVRGGVLYDGGSRFYQTWYRNSANFCTSATTNITNGVRVHWAR